MTTKSWICCICLDNNEEDCYILEPCNHKFHSKCLIESLRKCGPKCPYCRGTENSEELNNEFVSEEYIRVNCFNTEWISNLDPSYNELFNSVDLNENIFDDISSIESEYDSDRINILDDIDETLIITEIVDSTD